MRRAQGFVLATLLLLFVACGDDGDGDGLRSFFEVEPNDDFSQADLVTNRASIFGEIDPSDTDWFGTTVSETRRFQIDAFVTEDDVAALFQVFPLDGRFEDTAVQSIRDGAGTRFTGRFVPTGGGSGIAISVDGQGGFGGYQINVRIPP